MPDAEIAYLTGRGQGPRPHAVGEKFTPEGEVMPFSGTTTLCHIPARTPLHDALIAAQNRLRAGPHSGAFAFLPPASFHMTVFEGVTDQHRHRPRWPAHLSLDASVPEVLADGAARLDGVRLPDRFAVRMTGLFGGYSIRLSGANAAQETALRQARRDLAERLAIHRPDHDSYGFHITLAYLLRWLDAQSAKAVMDLSAKVMRDLAPILNGAKLGPVTYCHFEDMYAFAPKAVLA